MLYYRGKKYTGISRAEAFKVNRASGVSMLLSKGIKGYVLIGPEVRPQGQDSVSPGVSIFQNPHS